MFLLFFIYLLPFVLFYFNYNTYKNYFFVFLLDIVFKHLSRTDIELLKLNKNYKIVFFIEYYIYVFPLLVVLFLKEEFVLLVSILSFLLILINLTKINLKRIQYPFQLFSPFWHITFRKYKLVFVLPIILLFIYMAIEHNNENIIYFTFIILGLISCIPSFERERFEEIQRTPLDSEKYLLNQFKNSIINTSFLIIPFAIILCSLLKWNMLLYLVAVLILPLINILLKYTFFTNSFLHQIVFTFFVVLTITMFGIPLLSIPYLYKKAIKTINMIKYANH